MVISNLSVSYGDKKILSDISYKFEAGKCYFILGKNGAGKTSLFKAILNLIEHTGYVEYSSIDASFDESFIYDKLTGRDNMRYFCHNQQDFFQLGEELLNQKVSSYSYGQKRKCCLNICFSMNTDVILLDEASNGLDVDSLEILKKQIKNSGKTLILTGHQLDFYDDIIDTIIILEDGKFKRSIDTNHFSTISYEIKFKKTGKIEKYIFESQRKAVAYLHNNADEIAEFKEISKIKDIYESNF